MKDLEKVNPEVDLTNPYFFCENGEILWHDLSAIIGRHLYEQGKIESPQPREVPPHDWRDLFGDFTPAALGCNARSRADRLRTMGWHPTQPSIAEAFVNEDAPVLLREVISGP